MGRNNINVGGKSRSTCNSGCGCSTPEPMEKNCDALKNFNISMGGVSGVTCEGEMFNFPISVINPKNNKNESINEVLFELCKSIVNLKTVDDCIVLNKEDCDTEISINVMNFINKVCSSEEAKNALVECLDIENNVVTSLDFDEDILTLTQSLGDDIEVTIPPFVETVTNITITPTGFTYVNENGDSVDYVSPVPNLASVVDNDDGTFTFTDQDGNTTTVNMCCDDVVTTFVPNADGTITYTNEAGEVVTSILPAETVTPLVDNGDGTYTYTDEAGNETVISTTVDVNVDFVSYDPATKTITITETDGTVHPINISDLIDSETITSLLIQVDGSAIYTNENGDQTTIPAPVTIKSTSGSLNIQSTGTATTPCYDLNVNFPQENIVTSLPFDSNTNILTLAQSNGPNVTTDLSSLVSDPETVTTTVINPDGSVTHTNENGDVVIVPGTCNDIENFDDVGTVLPPLKVVTFDPVDGGCGIGTLPDIEYTCDELLEELQNNPEKAAEFTAIIDIRAVGFNWNGATDTATITMSNGDILDTVIDGLPVNGTYMPNASGVVNIPLTNGTFVVLEGLVSPPDNDIASFTTVDNGDGTFTVTPVLQDATTLAPFTVGQDTISPDDVDFASTTVTVAPDGSQTITYFDSDGNVITTSVLADQDDFLSSLALTGPDGCVLTGTLDGGATVTVDLCSLTSSVTETANADGSTTFTHSDGTSWTIFPQYRLRSCATNAVIPYDGTVLTSGIVSCRIAGRNLRLRECNGNTITDVDTYTDFAVSNHILNLANTSINSTTAEGTVLGESQRDVNLPLCGRNVKIMLEHSALTDEFFKGLIVPRPQFSIDGGATYVNEIIGGQDAHAINNTVSSTGTIPDDIGTAGERSFTGWMYFPNMPAGINDTRFRLVIERNEIEQGSLVMGIANARVEWTEEKKCDV